MKDYTPKIRTIVTLILIITLLSELPKSKLESFCKNGTGLFAKRVISTFINQCAIQWALKITPHFERLATLTCEYC